MGFGAESIFQHFDLNHEIHNIFSANITTKNMKILSTRDPALITTQNKLHYSPHATASFVFNKIELKSFSLGKFLLALRRQKFEYEAIEV